TLVACLEVESLAATNDVARVRVAVVGAHGHERAAVTHLLVVVLRLVLGDAESNEGARDATGDRARHGAGRAAREGRREQTAGDHRADARNEERRGGADQAAEHHAGAGTRSGHLAGLVALGVGLAFVVTPGVADLVVLEALLAKVPGCQLGVASLVEDANVVLASGRAVLRLL